MSTKRFHNTNGARIQPGDLVQIVENIRRKPLQPPVYGLVLEWVYSKRVENYWSCLWSNGMSTDVHAAESELEVVSRA